MYRTIGGVRCVHGLASAIARSLSSYRVIGILWVLGTLLALPPLLGWSYYEPEANAMTYVKL